MPIRLVVGHQSLELGAQVRILYRQPTGTYETTMVPEAWPVRLVAQDTALSRLKQGFDSPTGYHQRAVWMTKPNRWGGKRG